jgi:hypothetical protein
MSVKHSPGGSLFPYYYKNGEIHCLKYGGFHADEAGLFALMHAEEEFIAKQGRLYIWVDFYETKLTSRVLAEFIESTHRQEKHIAKLAPVGFSFRYRWRFRYLKEKSGYEFPFPVQFYSDPEEAKTWLVGKTI